MQDISPCTADAKCTNTEGSFNCTCLQGFMSVEESCTGKI